MLKPKHTQTALNGGIDFSEATEGALLQFCIGLYGLKHPHESGKTAFAQRIEKTEPFIDKCLLDIAHLGYKDWQKIQALLPIKVFDVWTSFQQEQFDFEQQKPKENR